MEDKALQKALSETPLFFDRVYYLKRYPDARVAPESALEHFCRVGIEEQRSPSVWFDPKYYLEANPDVKESGANPILHYLEYGQYERRATNPSITLQDAKRVLDSGLFDREFYLNEYEDVRERTLDPLYHYLTLGYLEWRNPSLGFDTYYYVKKYGVKGPPLLHYLEHDTNATRPKNSLIFERKSRHESRKSIAVVLHIYYVELVPQIKKHLQNIPYKFDLLVSTMSETQKIECETLFQDTHNLGRVDVRVVPNIGRDVAPLLITFKDAWSEYEYICHIHTKRSPHTPWGDMWRAFIYEKLLGDPQIIRETLEYLERDEECALLFPENFPAIKGHMHNKKNTPEIKRLLERVNYTKEKSYRGYDFAAGTMQWFKTKHFRELVALEFEHKEFKNSNSDLDGTLAHALERFFSIYAQKSGHRVLSYYSESRNRYLLSDSKYYS